MSITATNAMVSGAVINIEVKRTGTATSADHASGVTVLNVEDLYDFSESGGQLSIQGTTYSYVTCDVETNTITLATALTAAVEDDIPVLIYPASSEKWAMIRTDDNEDALMARVPHSLAEKFPEGVRETDAQESVLCNIERSQWAIVDIIALKPIFDAAYLPPVTVAADTTIPNAPTALVLTSRVVFDRNAYTAIIDASWTAPTTNTDSSAIDDLLGYEVQYQRQGDSLWINGAFVGAAQTSINGLVPGANYTVRVRATDTSAHVSGWLTSASTQATYDTTPPSTPSAPQSSSARGIVSVWHDWTKAAGGTLESDTARLDVHMSQTTGFTPSGTTLKGSVYKAGDLLSVTDLPQNTNNWYIVVVAYDYAGNGSTKSAQKTQVVSYITTNDLATALNNEIDQAQADATAAGNAASAAQTAANNAQTTANGKNKVTYSTSAASGANAVGDVWFQIDGTGKVIAQWFGAGGTSWNATSLTNSVIATLDAAKITTGTLDANRIAANSLSIGQVSGLQTSLNTKVSTFSQSSIPTSTAIGDIWIDTTNAAPNQKTYRAAAVGATTIGAGAWVLVGDPTAKTKTFAQTSIPTSVAIGDTWFDTDDGNKMYVARAVGATTIAAGQWELTNDPAAGGVKTFAQSATPTSTAAGDLWIKTDADNKVYRAFAAGVNTIGASGWVLYTQTITTTFAQPGIPTSINVGDTWYDTDDSNKQYRAAVAGATTIGAGAWVEVTDSRVNSWTYPGSTTIDGGKLQTNTITANAIAARVIGTDKLLVGGVTNLVPNGAGEWAVMGGMFPSGTTGISFDTSDKPSELNGCFYNTTAATLTPNCDSTLLWDCEPGMEFLVEVWAKASVANSRMTVEIVDYNSGNASSFSVAPNGTQNYAGANGYALYQLNVPTTWTKYSAVLTCGAGDYKMRVNKIYFNEVGGGVTNATQRVAVRVRSRATGQLVVDGTITALKLAVNSVDADKIVAGSINASKFTLGTLTINPINNPGFQDAFNYTLWTDPGQGDTSGWRRTFTANAQATRDILYAHSGNYRGTLRITGAGGTGDTAEWYSNAFQVQANSTFRVSWSCIAYGAGANTQGGARLFIDALFGPNAAAVAQGATTVNILDATTAMTVPYSPQASITPDTYQDSSEDLPIPAGQTDLWCVLRFRSTNNAADTVILLDDIACLLPMVGGASEYTSAGLRLFDENGDELAAFVSNRPNYLTVKDVLGNTVGGISNTGDLLGNELTVNGEQILQGNPMVGRYGLSKPTTVDYQAPGGRSYDTEPLGLLESVAWGNVARYFSNGSNFTKVATNGQQYHLFNLAADFLPGRVYLIYTNAIWVNISAVTVANAYAWAYIRRTTDGTDPTVGSSIVARSFVHADTGSGGWISIPPLLHRFDMSSQSVMTDVRFGLFLQPVNCSLDLQDEALWMYVDDVGPLVVSTGTKVDSVAGTAPPPTLKTYVKTYNTNGWATYRSKNALFRGGEGNVGDTSSKVYQGYSSSGSYNGDQRGLWTFPSITADVGTGTITKVEAYVYVDHWYNSSGGTLKFATHNYADQGWPTGAVPSLTYQMSKTMTSTGGVWVTLPSSTYAGFKAGTIKGFGIGPAGTTSTSYYGYCDDTTAQLRVTYQK